LAEIKIIFRKQSVPGESVVPCSPRVSEEQQQSASVHLPAGIFHISLVAAEKWLPLASAHQFSWRSSGHIVANKRKANYIYSNLRFWSEAVGAGYLLSAGSGIFSELEDSSSHLGRERKHL